LRENETIITNEGEHEIEETPQPQGEERQIQEKISKNPQRQEEVERGIEEIPLQRSTQIPQTSTRLHDFVIYKV
jgi:hypothetical protein